MLLKIKFKDSHSKWPVEFACVGRHHLAVA